MLEGIRTLLSEQTFKQRDFLAKERISIIGKIQSGTKHSNISRIYITIGKERFVSLKYRNLNYDNIETLNDVNSPEVVLKAPTPRPVSSPHDAHLRLVVILSKVASADRSAGSVVDLFVYLG